MLKIKTHITIIKPLILTWFVLFSLSPCTVKEVFFNSVNTSYTKPLNKSRTTSQTSFCSYSQSDIQQISFVKKSKINKQVKPFYSTVNHCSDLISPQDYNHYSKTSSGNSPPKYILYKRLKIDIA